MGVLVLGLKRKQEVTIGDDIVVSVNGYEKGCYKLCVKAPPEIEVQRQAKPKSYYRNPRLGPLPTERNDDTATATTHTERSGNVETREGV